MLIKRNNRFKKLFNNFLKNKTTNYSTTTSYSYNSYSTTLTIYFYEWSDVLGKSRTFYSLDAFRKYLNESKIYYTEEQIAAIKKSSYCYCSCIPGKPILMVEFQYYAIRDKLIDYKKNKDVCTAVVLVKNQNNGQ